VTVGGKTVVVDPALEAEGLPDQDAAAPDNEGNDPKANGKFIIPTRIIASRDRRLTDTGQRPLRVPTHPRYPRTRVLPSPINPINRRPPRRYHPMQHLPWIRRAQMLANLRSCR
jgi:hypothetical protein